MPLGHLIALISNAHRIQSAEHRLGEKQLLRVNFGSVRIAQKDQKSSG